MNDINNLIKLLILDIDGVLTDGTKIYDKNHTVISKLFQDKDFTAIKRFKASGVKVITISGDIWNQGMAKKRNLDFYHSRSNEGELDKSRFLGLFEINYNIKKDNMAFVCDDYFDLGLVEKLKYSFCTYDAPLIVKTKCFKTLNSEGGKGVLVELYDFMLHENWIRHSTQKEVIALDKIENASKEMLTS